MRACNRKMESLAEAIMYQSGYANPSSEIYQARNPGGLKVTSMKHSSDANGHRVFVSFIDGFTALLFDLEKKINGHSWTGLGPDDTLKDLAASYLFPAATATAWSTFLRAALSDCTITSDTSLKYFIQKD